MDNGTTDESKGRPGRKARQQSRPIIFERIGSRVERKLPMSAKTAADLDEYITWACGMEGADEQEALILTVDQALSSFFARDKLFEEYRAQKQKKPGDGTPSASPSSQVSPRPGVSP